MEWQEALEIAIARTGVERYRWLCSDENPDPTQRVVVRRRVVEIATDSPQSDEPVKFPSLVQRAVNLAIAVKKHVAAGLPRLSREDTEARLAVCRDCPQFHDHTCRICGCDMRIKATWAEQKCPLGKWPEREEHHEMVEQASGHDQESR